MNDQTKYLLVPATGDIDEDEGMTKRQLLFMLAGEQGYTLSKGAGEEGAAESVGAEDEAMSPDWKDAPLWARYFVVYRDGEAYWFENKPVPELVTGRVARWRQTLQERPAPRQPVALSMSRWVFKEWKRHEYGDLHFVVQVLDDLQQVVPNRTERFAMRSEAMKRARFLNEHGTHVQVLTELAFCEREEGSP